MQLSQQSTITFSLFIASWTFVHKFSVCYFHRDFIILIDIEKLRSLPFLRCFYVGCYGISNQMIFSLAFCILSFERILLRCVEALSVFFVMSISISIQRRISHAKYLTMIFTTNCSLRRVMDSIKISEFSLDLKLENKTHFAVFCHIKCFMESTLYFLCCKNGTQPLVSISW